MAGGVFPSASHFLEFGIQKKLKGLQLGLIRSSIYSLEESEGEESALLLPVFARKGFMVFPFVSLQYGSHLNRKILHEGGFAAILIPNYEDIEVGRNLLGSRSQQRL